MLAKTDAKIIPQTVCDNKKRERKAISYCIFDANQAN